MRDSEVVTVPAAVSGTSSGGSPSSARQQGAKSARKRAPGGQPANRNRVSHGAYLNTLKRAARDLRDRFRRKGEREAAAILRATGLTGDPMGRLVARQVGRLEAMAHRLEAFHDRRGYFDAAGDLKASVSKQVEVVGKLLDEARRLLEQLREISRGEGPADGIYRTARCQCTPEMLTPGPTPAGMGMSFRPPPAPSTPPPTTKPEDERAAPETESDAPPPTPGSPPPTTRKATARLGLGWSDREVDPDAY